MDEERDRSNTAAARDGFEWGAGPGLVLQKSRHKVEF